MKKKIIEYIKKYYMIAIILLLSVVFLFKQYQVSKLQDANQLQKIELSTLNDSISVYKSKNGELTFKLQSVEAESSNRKKALEAAGFEIKDLKQRNIKWRDINFALRAELESSGSGTIILRDTIIKEIGGDSISVKVGDWNNDHLYLSPYLVLNKLDFKYKYKVGIEVIGEKNNVISLGLTDENAEITTGNSITIKPDKHWWNKWYIYAGAGFVGGYFLFK